jgi:hypothetical protein
MKYLFDSNIFIQAKNLHYRFDFCKSFWEWIIKAHQAGFVFSIDKIKAELKKGRADDPINNWIEHNLLTTFFLPDTRDTQVMISYKKIMIWLASNKHYTIQAKNEFARDDVADAFLIAVAKTYGYTIVTHEQSRPEAKKRILIPDTAKVFGVKTIMIYDLLSLHAEGNFSFKTL